MRELKANYAISDKVGLMVGAFNDTWNMYKADPIKGLNALGLSCLFPADGISAYLLDGFLLVVL
jgi:hypothetical protein